LRILVADDNRDAAESLAVLLRMSGHEVRVAYDGAAALEIASAFLPRLALVDLGMPGLSGYEVARKIRARVGLARMYLAALTGWGQAKDRLSSHEAGFDDHFVKPIEPALREKLLERIHQRDASEPEPD
jgi:DNA-binding response OmpR family regulator